MIKKQTEASAEKRLDMVFSEYIKIRDTENWTREPLCMCCGKRIKMSQLGETGHIEKRRNHATRWDEHNAFYIHFECNRNDLPFKMLPEKYLTGLKVKAQSLTKFFEWELEEMITEYKQKIKELKNASK